VAGVKCPGASGDSRVGHGKPIASGGDARQFATEGAIKTHGSVIEQRFFHCLGDLIDAVAT